MRLVGQRKGCGLFRGRERKKNDHGDFLAQNFGRDVEKEKEKNEIQNSRKRGPNQVYRDRAKKIQIIGKESSRRGKRDQLTNESEGEGGSGFYIIGEGEMVTDEL